MLSEPPLIAIAGPTASGKTAVGIALAQKLNGEIVSADAVSVYRRLNIGAAKPSEEEQANAPFHLVDVVDPDQNFTLADFSQRADAAIADIRSRGRTPILVGGTGLYIRSVTATLSVPHVPPQPELRAALWAEVERDGAPALHAQLNRIDPVSAAKILSGDAKRIIRALEVYRISGRPMSDFHTPEGVQGIPRKNTSIFALNWEREELYRRIELRIDIMMECGFLDEVQGLLDSGFSPDLKSMQSLGYRHLCDHLTNGTPLLDALGSLKQDTRRFAKRQISWFKADPSVRWIDVTSEPMAEAVADKIIQKLSFAEDWKKFDEQSNG